MTELLVHANSQATGTSPIVRVTPESAGWTYVGFEVYRSNPSDTVTVSSEDRETTVIVLEGTCDISVDGTVFSDVGSRSSVFSDESPEAIYSPPGRVIRIQAKTQTEFAIATSSSDTFDGQARRIGSGDIPYERRGSGSTERYIRHILDEHHEAVKLLLVEVVTPSGNWSSYPPHKHDEESSVEAYLEETYYYRINPPHGQALQRVYDKSELNAVLTPSDGDVVIVPRGYHPVSCPPGFTTYYLNVMAGHHRVWKYQLDEDYAHVAPKDGNIMGQLEFKK
ncbi:5-deoxy-glucuronate isomerase [Alicyclobacillus curvatus]|nr:5-deoxy-glucuronate isomerase [Alicyclobacillus curvatus]